MPIRLRARRRAGRSEAKGDPRSSALLNDRDQPGIVHRDGRNWGHGGLAKHARVWALTMKRADWVIERILFLQGRNMAGSRFVIGGSVPMDQRHGRSRRHRGARPASRPARAGDHATRGNARDRPSEERASHRLVGAKRQIKSGIRGTLMRRGRA
jgi:hypothetical protein